MWIELVAPLLVPVLTEPAADLVTPGTSRSAGAPLKGRRPRRGLKPRALPRAIRAQPGPPAAVCTTVLVVVVPMTARAADHISSNRFRPKCFCLKRRTRRLLTELLPVTHFYRRQRTASLRVRKNPSYVATAFRQAACAANVLKTFYRKNVVISQIGIAFLVPAPPSKTGDSGQLWLNPFQ